MTTIGNAPSTRTLAPLAPGRFADDAAAPGQYPAWTRRARQPRSHLQASVIADQSALLAVRPTQPDGWPR